MESPRRMGSSDSDKRLALLDAAEEIMVEEGYPAATSRRVAQKAGLKHQLVHYYFRDMDELFLAAFRRRAEFGLTLQAEALKSAKPGWALWRWSTHASDVPLWLEYIAMANHRKALRAEISRYSARFREEQRWIVTRALEAYGVDLDDLPAMVAIVFMSSISRVLDIERCLDMSVGHDETVGYIERHLRRLEGEPPTEQSYGEAGPSTL
jgi:AcrR family transcriptional regulator